MNILGMAGPAEAGAAIALMISWGSLAVLIVLTVAAVTVPGKWLSFLLFALTLILAAGTAVLFQPWWAFAPLSAEDQADPDAIMWTNSFRNYAVGWLVAMVIVVGGTIYVAAKRSWRDGNRLG